MKVLFDMVHPADVHFFKHAISSLQATGHEVIVASREKDVTLDLLDQYEISHYPITRKGQGALGLFWELIVRDVKLLWLSLKFRPDVYLGNNSPCSSHVAWLLRKPSLVFDDTEIHRHNRRLYYPFVSEVHTPACFRDDIGSKQLRFNSYHALAYLHPDHFVPDKSVLARNGIDVSEPYVLVRFVSWGAMHDIGLQQLSATQKKDLVEEMARYAKVYISAESELEDELKKYQVNVPVEDVHHLLAYADLVVGESATMCCEASVLGTFSIYIDEKGRGYTDELEKEYQLCKNFKPGEYDDIRREVIGFLENRSDSLESVRQDFDRMMADMINLSDYQMDQINRLYAGG
ncbi:MAG: DUF354 domain-containing protein [Chromatiales bacterium]|jgi:predicted glycosyltransferase